MMRQVHKKMKSRLENKVRVELTDAENEAVKKRREEKDKSETTKWAISNLFAICNWLMVER